MSEPEEVEGSGLRTPTGAPLLLGVAAERKQPGLVGVQFQAEPRKPLAQLIQERLGLLTMLKSNDEVVGEAHDHDISVRPSLPPALDPEVEHSVGVRLPSSSTPALSHFWIRRTTRRSAMRCSPTFCKVLVRCNPEGDAAMNRRQAGRLRHLSDYLHRTGRKFMFELLVPAEQAELEELHGDKRAYDRSRRPRHMVDAIHELQDAGVEPDVWKIEGLDRTEDCVAVVAAARRAGRAGVGCIVLGRGEDEAKVESWLSTAARVPGFIGFAVGRTTFWDALVGWRDGRTTREAASAEIARRSGRSPSARAPCSRST